jgi:uncharacterized protein (DUF1697 family)
MSIHIALLRGINVGGRNQIAMSDLRDLLETLGFAGVKSLLQSGNFVFPSDRTTGATLERFLEAETVRRMKLTIDYFVRTAEEWQTIIARNPFPIEAKSDPSHLVVMFMKVEPSAKGVEALRAAIKGPEVVRPEGKHLYVVYPAGIGRSKLTGALIEQKLGSRGTGRNWNTILKLAAIALERGSLG